MPGIGVALRVKPRVIDFGGGGGNLAFQIDFHRLHIGSHDFFLFCLKKCSRRSRCSLQYRSYSCTHNATLRSGAALSSMTWSLPRFSRWINPAASSTLRCLETAFSDISNGSAISVTRAGPLDSRARIARRDG